MGGRHRRRGVRPPGGPSAPADRAAPALALAVTLVLATGCTLRTRPEPAPSSTVATAAAATTGSVARGRSVAQRAFTLVRSGSRGGDSLRPAPPGPLPLAMRERGDETDADTMVTLVLVFPLLRVPPDCVRQLELWLRVLRFDHQFRYQDPQLSAYPSLLVSLASARPSTRHGDETLLDNRPKGDAELTGDETWMHFEITELYRIWAEGGPFPSQGRTVPKGTPLVVDIRAADMGQQLFEARVAPIGGDREAAPQLRWTAARDCPASG